LEIGDAAFDGLLSNSQLAAIQEHNEDYNEEPAEIRGVIHKNKLVHPIIRSVVDISIRTTAWAQEWIWVV
jgi:hypothetical protein